MSRRCAGVGPTENRRRGPCAPPRRCSALRGSFASVAGAPDAGGGGVAAVAAAGAAGREGAVFAVVVAGAGGGGVLAAARSAPPLPASSAGATRFAPLFPDDAAAAPLAAA